MNRFAKIVATIGPASQSEEKIRQLILAGINVARLNFSHGTYSDHKKVFQTIRKLSSELNTSIMILQDLQGPKLRIGNLLEDSYELINGEHITLTTRSIQGTHQLIPVDFPQLPMISKPGFDILIDDGNLDLKIIEVNEDSVETEVIQGGVLKPHKGVNFPGIKIEIPGLTNKDKEDLKFGLSLGIDAVAISFVQNEQDILSVRQEMIEFSNNKSQIPIIAKLERPQAIENLEKIILESDGVMVARGDLGVEMRPEEVPIIQKRIIAAANKYTKYCITATQMLDSMISNPRPTRAEASDVANAILDGTDAVMLSGETAIGKYPVQSVKMMDAIIRQAEVNCLEFGSRISVDHEENNQDDPYYVTRAAKELAKDRNVEAIAVFTLTGKSAFLMSKQRPNVPILAFTPNIDTYQKLGSYWGVCPRLVNQANTIEMMIQVVDASILEKGHLKSGQQIVLICGFPIIENRPTNLALLHTVGE